MLIENEFVMWIKEIKGLCFARTRVYCSSWQLGNLPPSASYPLPPSAGQPAIWASCLLCVWVEWVGRGSQAVHAVYSVYSCFAKTVIEWGRGAVGGVGKWGTATTLTLLHWSNSRTTAMTSVWSWGIAVSCRRTGKPRSWKGAGRGQHPKVAVLMRRVHQEPSLKASDPQIQLVIQMVRYHYPAAILVFHLSVHSSLSWFRG